MQRGTRPGDRSDALYFRSDRLTLINGHYFFATREGTLEGPFASRQEALFAIESYIRQRQTHLAGLPFSEALHAHHPR